MPKTEKSAAAVGTPNKAVAKLGFIDSMECLGVTTLPDGDEWTYEIKLYRLGTGVWTWGFAEKTCDEKRTSLVHG